MTNNKTRSLRSKLLIGASIGSMLLAGVAEAQSGRGRGGASVDPADAAIRAAQEQAQRQAQSNTASQRAIQSFRRAAESRAAMQEVQAAARAAAKAAQNNVPNGLGQGGLQVANGVSLDPSLWVGANGPAQTTGADGRTVVTVGQTESKAILTWDSFNVGRETDLVFNQKGNADWVALNRVNAGTDPTRILGNIKADGSVYIINRNGIIFGGASQANTRNLIASTADIATDQFLNRGIYSQLAGANYVPVFTSAGGAVAVEAGAQITTNAPKAVVDGGGYVMLLGSQVTNAGSITTVRGQTLLAAGDDFLVRSGVATEANQQSTTRGNEVLALIGAGSAAGSVTNSGQIEAQQGDITLTGRNVLQDGVLLATTSVNRRGTIHLSTSVADATSSVVLTGDSLTAILPELDSKETALDAQRNALIAESARMNALREQQVGSQFDNLSLLGDRRDQSRVEIVSGGDVLFEDGSATLAQGGQVSVTAADRIQTESGASIDVAGVRGVALDAGSNAIKVRIQPNELRDSPANRETGTLNNQEVWVDARDLTYIPSGTGGYSSDRWYTPGGLLEVGGFLANTSHGIGEWTSVGGTITLAANEVVAKEGSVFNVAGGSIDYAAGYVRSSMILGADGRLYDVRNMPSHIEAVSVGNAFVVKHERWGSQYNEVYVNRLFSRGTTMRWDEGYTVGRDGGRLILAAPTVVFDAAIHADVITGERQMKARPDNVVDAYKLGQSQVALAGGLAIGRWSTGGQAGGFDGRVEIGDTDAIDAAGGLDVLVTDDRLNTVLLDAGRLSGFSLGTLQIAVGGPLTVTSDLTLADGGRLSIAAASIDIAADVTARSGSVEISNIARHAGNGAVTDPTLDGSSFLAGADAAHFTLRDGASVDLRGLWANGREGASSTSTAHIDGGNVDIRMVRGSITLEEGSLIDVSSGATLEQSGELVGGRGGDVALIAGALDGTGAAGSGLNPVDARLTLDGNIRAWGVEGGGTLTLHSPVTTVFGQDEVTALLASGVLPAGMAAPTAVILAEDVTIKAGQPLPSAISQQMTTVPLDTPLPQAVDVAGFGEITTLADWVVEVDAVVDINYNYYWRGMVLPAGTVITGFNNNRLDPGVVLPSSVFPAGIPLQAPFTFKAEAGETVSFDYSFVAGRTIAAGTQFADEVRFQAASSIDPDLLKSGFSNYVMTSRGGLRVAAGETLQAATPVLRQTANSHDAPTGSDPSKALELWTPPVFQEDALHSQLHQRAGADLTLRAADIHFAEGSRIEVDPGHRIRLAAQGSQIVEGDLIARGGRITAITEGVLDPLFSHDFVHYREPLVPFRAEPIEIRDGASIWIGGNAHLDVSGLGVSAVDRDGRRYGLAQDGGRIQLGVEDYQRVDRRDFVRTSNMPVILREGARLDASGVGVVVDLVAGDRLTGSTRPITLAGDGGQIQLGSQRSIFNDASMFAKAGGEGAAGGVLNLVLENNINYAHPGYKVLTIGQTRTASGLPAEMQPDALSGANLPEGVARISVEEIEAGGFGTLDLLSRDVFAFEGDVSLKMGESLILRRGLIAAADPLTPTAVSLSAAYMLLDGWVAPETGESEVVAGIRTNNSPSFLYPGSSTNLGRLSISADLIDIENQVMVGAHDFTGRVGVPSEQQSIDLPGFATIDLTSRTDIRFTNGQLATSGDTTLTSSQIYPTTMSTGMIRLGHGRDASDPDLTLTIRGNGATPAMPYSVFGRMVLAAAHIDQGGVVRAPLGSVTLTGRATALSGGLYLGAGDTAVTLRAGSVTSTSAAGLTMPYGGVSDGVEYRYDGKIIKFEDVLDTLIQSTDGSQRPVGIVFGNSTLTAEEGAVLDVSGGGELTGAGFVGGRGGSVDVLRHALADANPSYGQSGDNQVYAIVPESAAFYAPVAPDEGAGAPAVGRRITLDRAIGGLAAGTYVLMPSTYALLPGAYRVEIGARAGVDTAVVAQNSGSYIAQGYLSTAATGVRDALPSTLIVTPAAAVRRLSYYDETTYAAFATSQAAIFGYSQPRTERDAMNIRLNLRPLGDVLDFRGVARLNGAKDGRGGGVFITGGPSFAPAPIEVRPDGMIASADVVSLSDRDLVGLGSGTLVLGGSYDLVTVYEAGATIGMAVAIDGGGPVIVRRGTNLRAGDIFLTGSQLVVEGGAVIDASTIGTGVLSNSIYPVTSNGNSVLTVAGGRVDVRARVDATPDGGIRIEDGATLRAGGSLGFTTAGKTTLGDASLAARYLTFAGTTLDVGHDAVLAEVAQTGVIGGDASLSVEKIMDLAGGTLGLEKLVLNTSGSLNLYGDFTLDLRGRGAKDVDLVLQTPAIYGWGAVTDTAHILTDNLTWTGQTRGSGSGIISGVTDPNPFTSAPSSPVVAGGAGTGSSRLVLEADRLTFGYEPGARRQDQATVDRLALGFSATNLTAHEQLTSNTRGTLSAYGQGTGPASYAGGELTIGTPVITGDSGSFMAFRTGGDLNVSAPAGGKPFTPAATDHLGAELRLVGSRVTLDTPVVLLSGRLVVEAEHGIHLGANADLDLSGRTVDFFDKSIFTPGGDVVLETTQGAVIQHADSSINVSAGRSDGGSIRIVAAGADGLAVLDGLLRGNGAQGQDGGTFSLRVKALDDFAALNRQLNEGGFFRARSFTIGTGDMIIGDEVRARLLDISVDGGSLIVNGRIDASGERAGTIRLAARDDLTLTGGAVLDAHGTVLQVDGRNTPIEATNRGHIELASRSGVVGLASGAVIDLRSADSIARGQLEISARRLGTDDVAVDAAPGLIVRGAGSVAVNAMRTYAPGNGQVDQTLLDGIHGDSAAFIDAASGNDALGSRLAGLAGLGEAFHFRPGVEIVGDKLTVVGDIDLSGYRYGPDVDPAVRGSGETGLLLLRAADDLVINGSLTDGFAPPPVTVDDNNWGQLLPSGNISADLIIPADGLVLRAGDTRINLANVDSLDFDIALPFGATLYKGVLPVDVVLGYASFAEGDVLPAAVYDTSGAELYPAGHRFDAYTGLEAGVAVLRMGFDTSGLNGFFSTTNMTWPAGTSVAMLEHSYAIPVAANVVLPRGAVIPAGSSLQFEGTALVPSRPVGPDGTQGRMWAIAPMLAPGTASWSMRLVGGADLGAADTRALGTVAALGARGDVILDDAHYAGAPLVQASSVVRTGTGFLDILAGGDYRQETPFGVYTAGVQVQGAEAWNAARAANPNDPSTILGPNGAAYETTLNGQRMYFTQGGGDVLVSAQGDAVQQAVLVVDNGVTIPRLDTSTWLWRQGGEDLGLLTAWGINFGQYANFGSIYDQKVYLTGFTGLGTLGGGNLTMTVGGDAGFIQADPAGSFRGLYLAVGSSGRVTADGDLIQTGGGDVNLSVAGRLNSRHDPIGGAYGNVGGSVTNIRGDIGVRAGTIGLTEELSYGYTESLFDPRAPDDGLPGLRRGHSPLQIELGDGVADARARGDLVVVTGTNPGFTPLNGMTTAANLNSVSGAAAASFSLWTDRSAIGLLSLGGDIHQSVTSSLSVALVPGTVSAVAARGAISADLTLAPARGGSLSLLAWTGLYGQASMSSADSGDVPTPWNPRWSFSDMLDVENNPSQTNSNRTYPYPNEYFTFGTGEATALHANQDTPLVLYAATGDVILNTGSERTVAMGQSLINMPSHLVAQPVRIWAGRDIITNAIFMNNDADNVSVIRAGRDILNSEIEVFGPGYLEVSAGRNIYMNAKSQSDTEPGLNSSGPLVSGDRRPGAGITLMAGVGGAGAPDYARFAALYLDPANLAEAGAPLADQPGKVARVYDKELNVWLRERFGYEGSSDGVTAYFQALAPEQQSIFLNTIYFEELRQSGREYNDPGGRRFASYLRGRNAIEALFPSKDAAGGTIERAGSVTLLEAAGTHTDFGGDVTVIAPGGGVTLGTSTYIPPASTGLMTQGEGGINIFTRNNVLLGLSRVFTTFGGDIMMWSTNGDINAGRGAGGTVIYAPARIAYDQLGNVSLAPTVPTSGAGIGTLNPIPEVAPGDIDLIAPLGTIDAGEAGIRVSGNVNLAALQVINAANIQVQGDAKGIPLPPVVNTGALTAASSATSSVVAEATRLAERARPAVRTDVPVIVTVRLLGFGDAP